MRIHIKNIRPNLARAFTELFAEPYLPGSLTRMALVLAALSLAVILFAQPLLYWMDNQQAASRLPFLAFLLKTSPIAFLGASLVYLTLVWASVTLLTRRIALIAWLVVCYVHLLHLLTGLSLLLRLPSGSDPLASLIALAEQALGALLLGVSLSLWLLRRRSASQEVSALASSTPDLEPLAAVDQSVADASAIRPTRLLRNHLKVWQAALALVLLLVIGGGVLQITTAQRSGWRMIKPAHSPGNRTSSAVAYDPNTKKTLLFGGASLFLGEKFAMHNDLWAWDGKDWSLVEPQQDVTQLPEARMNHTMAYDAQRKVMVLFGGETIYGHTNDIWEWDGIAWTRRFPDNAERQPAPRMAHALYYDPSLGKIVVSGGYGGQDENKKNIFFHDVWTWDGNAWVEITGGNGNPFIAGATGEYDPSTNIALIMNFDGLLSWAGDHWKRQAAPDGPLPRQDARMTVIPAHGVALFAGAVGGQTQLNDLWIHTATGWQNPNSPLKPSPRIVPAFFYDPSRSALVVYGGSDNSATLGDMWEYPIHP